MENLENTNVGCKKHYCKILSIIAIVLSVISIILATVAIVKCNRPRHDFQMGPMGNMWDMPCNNFGSCPAFGQKPNMPQGNFSNGFGNGFDHRGRNFNGQGNNQGRGFNGNNNGNFGKGFDFNRPNNNNNNNNPPQNNGPTTAPEITPNAQ